MGVDTIRDEVRNRYAAAARSAAGGGTAQDCCVADSNAGGCCAGSAGSAGVGSAPGAGVGPADAFGAARYPDADLAQLPATAKQASLGCGNPLAVADLHEGETVLDLGSGAGADVLLSARRVGPTGRAHGLDMTDEMLALARRNAAEAGMTNVEFHRGTIEEIPLPDATVDVVISNCVINLSADKPAVFAEMFRVLRPGGRIGVTDVVADDSLTLADRGARGDWAACVAGALSRSEYLTGLSVAGFTDVEITASHDVDDRMYSAMIRALRP